MEPVDIAGRQEQVVQVASVETVAQVGLVVFLDTVVSAVIQALVEKVVTAEEAGIPVQVVVLGHLDSVATVALRATKGI